MNIALSIIGIILSPFTRICGRVVHLYERDMAQNIYISSKETGWFSKEERYDDSISCFPGSMSCFSCCSKEDTHENITLIGHTYYV